MDSRQRNLPNQLDRSFEKRIVAATGIELSATGLSLFVGAFYALTLRAHCLSLRSIFRLNMPALLHCCYILRFWDIWVIVVLLL